MYFLIAISLVFTVVLGVGLAFSAVSTAVWRIASSRLEFMASSTRASFLFYLRVLPLAFAVILSLLLVLPAFLLYEPYEPQETISWKLAAVVGVAIFGIAAAMFRVFASWWRTRRLIARWKKDSEPLDLAGAEIAAYRLRHHFPVFAIIGVLRPKLFVSEIVLKTLNENEIAAVLMHEHGHIASSDNLKRLLIRLCGDVLVAPVCRPLDRAWREFSESAADEFSVSQGGPHTALELAEALIKIARIIPENTSTPAPLVSFVLWSGESLTVRIRRLLALAESGVVRVGTINTKATIAGATLIATLILLASDHTVLANIHDVSELLLAALQ